MIVSLKQLNEFNNGILKADFKNFCEISSLYLYLDFEALVDDDLKQNGLCSAYLFYFDYIDLYKKLKISDFLYVEAFWEKLSVIDEYQVIRMFVNMIKED
ncbi:hypothetical protein [Mycoplasma sp. 31_09]|uniref:hypothetical protein n=1 Tax=Mycoplasma sp. 31_09 TaxID=3401663 RepID=UPI003AAFBFC1